MKSSRPYFSTAIATILIVMFAVAAQATAPRGWFVAGSKPQSYESGLDPSTPHMEHASAYLKAKSSSVDGFGTLMQHFRADHYLGKRVRFSAFVKTADAKNWAGLWMRVDKGQNSVAFDNMQDRPIRGDTDWRKCEVVLDVPQDATGVFFGVLLAGGGEVWINDAKIEVVGGEVPPTGGAQNHAMTDEPENLDFKE
ncbi:MAG TPA: hypothetical protein VJO35_17365 [Terriglobales bacterium]|nr:hypothetical protein [Terriglobales bacterium]